MALTFKDRVLATSTTTGSGTYTLGSAVTGFQAWSTIGDGNTAYYFAEEVDGSGIPSGGWEVGLGTYTSSGTTLARTTVLASSNSGSAVSWSAGTRRIGATAPATVIDNVACSVSRTTNQSVNDNTNTPVQFNVTDTYDPAAMHDPASNNTKITVPTAGVYAISGYVRYAGITGSPGLYAAAVLVNNTTNYDAGVFTANSIANSATFAIQLKLAAADYIEIIAYQTGPGSAVNLTSAAAQVTRIAAG